MYDSHAGQAIWDNWLGTIRKKAVVGMTPVAGYAHIEIDPGICAGQPRIMGTRITVALIAREVERLRLSPDEVIATHSHLTLAEVHSALAYFYDHRDEVEAAMREGDEIEAELRARFPPCVRELLAMKRS